jgi:predicted nucleotidyltransferase
MGIGYRCCHDSAFSCYNKCVTQHIWTPEELVVYRDTAIRLREQDREAEKERRERAWIAARAAAELLRGQFLATRVVVFGSLARESNSFTRWSDVDIAVWGLGERDSLNALGAVLDMDTGFEMNMVDVNVCKPAILESIAREGIDI